MKRSAIYSLLLHLVIAVFLTVGFYNPFKRKLTEQKPLMIEFVNIAERSRAPILAPQDVQETEPVEQSLLEKPEVEIEKKSLPKESQSEKKASQPESIKPEPIPESIPEPVKEPVSEPKPKEKEPEKIKEISKEKPKEKPVLKKEEEKTKAKEKVELNMEKKKPIPKIENKEDKKKLDNQINDILSEAIKDDQKPELAEKANSKKKGGKIKGAPADMVGEVVTGTEIDAIRRQIARCWIVPNGARDVRDLVVDLEMKIAQDGTVIQARVSDKSRMAHDQRFRAAAESAQRAVLDPKCNPLPLNPEKYEEWKDLEMSFNPKGMY